MHWILLFLRRQQREAALNVTRPQTDGVLRKSDQAWGSESQRTYWNDSFRGDKISGNYEEGIS